MKISFRDRIQAIKSSKAYQKDYQRYVKKRDQDGEEDLKLGPPWDPYNHLSTAGKQLCEKWGLQRPIAPDSPVEPFKPVGMPSEDLVAWMLDGAVYPVSFPIEDELKKPTLFDSGGQKVVTHLNGKLCLLIDTSCPSDMTMDVLREFVYHYAKETKDREGNPTAKPWEVYSMHQSGMNLWEITKIRFNVSARPVEDNESDSRYQQVKRAIFKAKRMIAFVEQEANKQSRLNKN